MRWGSGCAVASRISGLPAHLDHWPSVYILLRAPRIPPIPVSPSGNHLLLGQRALLVNNPSIPSKTELPSRGCSGCSGCPVAKNHLGKRNKSTPMLSEGELWFGVRVAQSTHELIRAQNSSLMSSVGNLEPRRHYYIPVSVGFVVSLNVLFA